jgi:hypothetical protein
MSYFLGFLFLLMSVLSCQAVTVFASSRDQQDSAAPEPPDLQMQFRTSTGSNRFQIGEVITIEILLSTTTPNRYLEPCELFVDLRTFGFPQCRFFSHWTFTLSPDQGWWDHLKDARGITTIGGPTFEVPSRDLTSQPQKFTYTLSNRFRFDQPGKYLVRLSLQVGLDDETTLRKANPDPGIRPHAVSVARELLLEIVPATAEWEQEIIRKGYQAYSGRVPPETNPPSAEFREYQQATQALCNLGTPEAARTFARLLSENRYVGSCLFRSPSFQAGVEEMQRLLIDPDAPVPRGFFNLLVALLNGDESRKSGMLMMSQPIVDRQRDVLFHALAQKRGQAQITSLVTVLSNPPRSKGTPFEMAYVLPFPEPVITLAAAKFDQIPENDQSWLVNSGWDSLRSPLMRPVVRRRAEAGDGQALLRWLQLDGPAAKAFIREEIVRPAPRFSSFYLRLPDSALPDEEKQIAANFVALRDPVELPRSASLLHRYATRAVLPDVLPFIDANLSKWSCWEQFPALAYLLKVSPQDAMPRVRLALDQARGGGCAQWAFFTYLGALEPCPVLEDMALAEIDDGTKFASDAADYLRQYGSAAMKAKLWDRMVRWNRGVPLAARKQAEIAPGGVDALQRAMVQALGRALVEGHAWLLSADDSSKLELLLGKDVIAQLMCNLRCGASPVVVTPGRYDIYGWLNNSSFGRPMDYLYPVERLHYRINQYDCPNLERLKEKLLQFPAGSSFDFARDFSDRDRDELIAISDFLWSHGYKVRNPQNWGFLQPDSP